MKKKLIGLLLGGLLATQANAALITGTTASVDSGRLDDGATVEVIVDGLFPAEGSPTRGAVGEPATAFWSHTVPSITQLLVDLGSVYRLEDLRMSVDGDDNYGLATSVDGVVFSTLKIIAQNMGEIDSGMDTFSTIASDAEYVEALDFAAREARYVRISNLSGVGAFSIGEIQAFGTTPGVLPLPSTLALVGIGLAALGLRRRR